MATSFFKKEIRGEKSILHNTTSRCCFFLSSAIKQDKKNGWGCGGNKMATALTLAQVFLIWLMTSLFSIIFSVTFKGPMRLNGFGDEKIPGI